MMMQGKNKDKIVVKWQAEMHLYLTLNSLAPVYYVIGVG
jgi:hypothetical protein